VAELWTIETYDAEFMRRLVHQPADGEILQHCSIAVEHDQRRRFGIAPHYKMCLSERKLPIQRMGRK
jgi:hypothetical protein